jgi:hypothetical protein
VTTDTPEVVEQEPTAEEKAKEEQEAEAGFNAGFAKVSGLKPPTGNNPADNTAAAAEPEKSAAEKEAEAKAKTEADAKTALDAAAAEKAAYDALPKSLRDEIAALKTVPGQLNKLAGHLGGMKSQLDVLATAKAAAKAQGADAPTDKQVQAALADPKAWERLTEDFPEWAGPVKAEFTAIRKELAAKASPTVDLDGLRKEVTANVTQAVDEAEERAFLRLKHPTWKADVRTPEFKAWLASQPAETVSLAESKLADDAIKLLDGYAGHRQKAVEADAARQRKEKRLEQAVTPKGTAVPTQTSLSDEEAFNRGFKRARGR